MRRFACPISSLLVATLLFAPTAIVAQTGTTTATTTATTTPPQAPPQGGGNGTALGIGLGVGAGLLAFGLLGGLSPISLTRSFGGRVATVIPCVSALGPSLHVTIIPAGVFPVTYIWTPATITYTWGPPRNPGQQLLGVADVPFVCFIPAKIPIPLYGLRMMTVGTSPVI